MLKGYPHRGTLLLLIGLSFVVGASMTARAQIRAASPERIGDTVICRIGNSSYKLTPDARFRFRANRKETQEAFDAVAPHTDLSSYIYTVPVTERINVEICPGDQGMNYIAYNRDWLLSVYNDTNGKWALYAIIAHEVGHYVLAHDRRSSGSNPRIELEADEYAGEILAKMRASLEEAQAAYRWGADHDETDTHPPLHKRLEAVERGWRKIRGGNDSAGGASETGSAGCANCIERGPVELKNSVYRGGPDNQFRFTFKIATVQFNTDDALLSRASEVTSDSNSHLWNNKKYYWTREKQEDRLLLAWKNLTTETMGWAVVQLHEGEWVYKTNGSQGKWERIDRGSERVKLLWNSSGQTVEIFLTAPSPSGGWTVNDIQYSFGYSN